MGDKKKLLVSFSGGETSAYMAQWLWNNRRDEYDMIFLFANTGEENEETLKFVQKCSEHFGFPVVWVECIPFYNKRKGSGHVIVDINTASRKGEPFERMIKKYGIPNHSFPHCTRELKLNPMKSYLKSIGWRKYFTAVGIREDEFDRMNAKRDKLRIIYPLIDPLFRPMTKPKINFWWSQQAFRLNLKGYQGNCKTCWKKTDSKLFQIAKEDPSKFETFMKLEDKYSLFPAGRAETVPPPYYFFRKCRSARDIMSQSLASNRQVVDDSNIFDDGDESCEVFSECK